MPMRKLRMGSFFINEARTRYEIRIPLWLLVVILLVLAVLLRMACVAWTTAR